MKTEACHVQIPDPMVCMLGRRTAVILHLLAITVSQQMAEKIKVSLLHFLSWDENLGPELSHAFDWLPPFCMQWPLLSPMPFWGMVDTWWCLFRQASFCFKCFIRTPNDALGSDHALICIWTLFEVLPASLTSFWSVLFCIIFCWFPIVGILYRGIPDHQCILWLVSHCPGDCWSWWRDSYSRQRLFSESLCYGFYCYSKIPRFEKSWFAFHAWF